jgi:hypothetical protein
VCVPKNYVPPPILSLPLFHHPHLIRFRQTRFVRRRVTCTERLHPLLFPKQSVFGFGETLTPFTVFRLFFTFLTSKMTLFNLVIILCTIILPIMASDSSTSSIGMVGTPLVLSSSPTPTISPKVGIPLKQSTTEDLGTRQPMQTFHAAFTLTNTGSAATSTPIVGTPIANSATTATSTSAANSTGGIVGKPLSLSNVNQHSLALPPYAVIVIVIFTIILFLTLAAFAVWRVYIHRSLNHKQKDVEEEDALEAYSKYWKGKRNSGGSVAKGNNVSSPIAEKVGSNTNV